MLSYFWINEILKILERVCFGEAAVLPVVIVRCQAVVPASLYVESSQILAQTPPISEEEPCNLQEVEAVATLRLQSLL
jgi:hypothetical protein